MPVNTLIQVRRGVKSAWDSAPGTVGRGILYQGELGYETDTGKIKIGDGTTHWASGLCYASVPLNTDNFIAGSGINIDLDSSCSSGAWSIDESWLENFIANSSGSLNVEGVQDIIGNSGVVGGFGINKDYNDTTGFTTISATGLALRVDASTGIGVSTSSENSNNVYTVSVTGIAHTLVTDWTEAVQDTIGLNAGSTGFLVNGTGVAWTYDDSGNSLEVAVTGIPHTLITDWDAAISGSIPDNVDTLLVEGDGIGLVYNSGANSLTIGVTGVLNDLHNNLTSTAAELNVLDGVTAGTVSAGDAVVVDGSKNIGDFNVVTAVTFSGDLVGGVTSDSVDINGGNIDGTVIGANSPAVISGTSIYASTGFIGDLTGNASSATNASNVSVSSTNGTGPYYISFVDGTTGSQAVEVDTNLTYNASSNTLTATNFAGNASTATRATNADNINIASKSSSDETTFIVLVGQNDAGDQAPFIDGANLSYNANTNVLSTDGISVATIDTSSNVTIGGNLTVAGTTTTVNSTVVEIGDNIIRVNTSGLPTGGLEVRNSGTTDYKQFVWDNVDGRWELGSENLQAEQFVSTIADGTAPFVVTSTTLVTNLNSDYLDGQHGSYYLDWGNFSNTPTPDVTVAVTGDVAGSSTVSNWNLSDNLSVSINTTIQPNSVALGTDTTGDYTESVGVTGSGIEISDSTPSDDGANYTITLNSSPNNNPGTVVVRDANGDFEGGTITAEDGFSGNGSSITNLNATNISSGTLNSSRLPTVSQTNTSTGPTASFVSSVTRDSYGRVTGVNTTTHDLATTTVKGIASFNTSDFSVSSGAVSIKTSGVSNTQLVNDSVTFGTTEVALGSSSDRIDGLVAISGTNAANPTVLTYCMIDGGTP